MFRTVRCKQQEEELLVHREIEIVNSLWLFSFLFNSLSLSLTLFTVTLSLSLSLTSSFSCLLITDPSLQEIHDIRGHPRADEFSTGAFHASGVVDIWNWSMKYTNRHLCIYIIFIYNCINTCSFKIDELILSERCHNALAFRRLSASRMISGRADPSIQASFRI